ncbi:hypothetical protein OF83DRAFT_307946 [Amylostereum chailletii]|nr:hypothetical protein OF83DRAFT_307946 [Amylostereum chailletii]
MLSSEPSRWPTGSPKQRESTSHRRCPSTSTGPPPKLPTSSSISTKFPNRIFLGKLLSSSTSPFPPSTSPPSSPPFVRSRLQPSPRNHYFRKFLTSPLAVGLPDFVASAFADGDGLEWMQRHSGPGYVCSLLSHMVRWCDVAMGDDKQAAISLPQRTAVLRKIADIRADEAAFKSLDKRQRELEIPFLEGTLKQRSHLEGRIPGVAYCGLDTCMEDTEDDELQACSRCKMVKYCGRECQTKAWKTHKFRCFAPTF